MAKKISIIVPCYNEEETVRTFYNEVRKVVASLDYYLKLYMLMMDLEIKPLMKY